jgi:hypothetical protein
MIETSNSIIASEVRKAYLKNLEVLTLQEERSVVVSHFGLFSQDLINSIAEGMEAQMVSSGDDRKTIKRLFSILIEGLQNIRSHGYHDEFSRQIAYVFVGKCVENYKVILGNIIRQEDQESLTHYIEKINKYGEEELKQHFLSTLSKGFNDQKKGAGLGLLTMRMKSGNLLNYSFHLVEGGVTILDVRVLLPR